MIFLFNYIALFQMTIYNFAILTLAVLTTHVICKIFEINTPTDLKTCFEQKRFLSNYSDPHWDNGHAYCVQKNNWHMLRTAWSNISVETENWVDELLRMSEYEVDGLRLKRQTQRNGRRPRPLRVRREYRLLSDAERNAFHRAINLLKEDTVSTDRQLNIKVLLS